MDTKDFIELDLQLGSALSEIKLLEGMVKARDERILYLEGLLQAVIKTAQGSYSRGSERTERLPEASGKEVSKEAF